MATGVFRVILLSVGFNDHTICYDFQYTVHLSEYGGDSVSTGRRETSWTIKNRIALKTEKNLTFYMLIDHNARKKYLQVMGDKFLVDILI
jgi:hypothetical protein